MHETFFLVLGLAGLLTVSSLLLPLANRINFPYTVLLALAGSMLGMLVLVLDDSQHTGLVADLLSSLRVLDITSEVVFFVFLPALIFESALNINVRHLAADLGPILLLAIIGLLISTLVVGFSVWSISTMSLVACLLIGTIVSATDPIAVISIFKSLGAPKRLTILVEGESLFNDATAIVLFTILAAILVEGSKASFLDATGRFLVVFLGGILVGLIASLIIASIIGRIRNLPLVEITLTICLAYLTFLWAEHYLHVSGVMAVVTAGLVINSYGRTQVSPETWSTLTDTWEELAFWANSLIFFLVGLLVPGLLSNMSGASAITLLTLTITAFLARGLVLFGVLPCLNRLGWSQKISMAFRTVMLWGGLRGAVSLALTLVILETPGIESEIKEFVAVLVTGFVLITLFVNAPTMGMLMHCFKLDQLPSIEQAIRCKVMALSLTHIGKDLEKAAQQDQISDSITAEVSKDYQQRLSDIRATMAEVGPLSKDIVQTVGLTTLINHERQLYLKRFSEGLISAAIARILLALADNLLDSLKANGVTGYHQAAHRPLGFGTLMKAMLMLHHHTGVTRPLAKLLADRFEVLRTIKAVVRTLIKYAQDKIPPLLGEQAATQLIEYLEYRLDKTQQALHCLEQQYPDYAETLQKRYLNRVALQLEETSYQRMLEERTISQEMFNDLIRDLDKHSHTLDQQPRLDLGLEPEKLVAQVPFFADLPADRLSIIAKQLKPLLVLPNEQIITKGETGDAMYFISSGAVMVEIGSQPKWLGSGDFFGEIALLTQEPRSATITTKSYCQLLELRVKDFHALLDNFTDLRNCLTEAASQRLEAEPLVRKVPFFAELDKQHISEIAKMLHPRLAAPNEKVVCKGDPDDTLYFIASGMLEALVETEIKQLGPGDFFGEIALLTHARRTVDVVATQYSQLLALRSEDFQHFLSTSPNLRKRIHQVARERLGVDV
ncbi:cation:proton antiporter [Motiliproteus sp. MSK22-1]|uniref:cation:proton antiporter n=1 Tax=Motiliproteus sp. MSK22-1 TaxID=1897630 RepID=UPI0009772EB3|nr:cation:proton antiporter [Motiliproteus sp. MSK22-1]OMH33740.1 hypothetical protein BGP75_12130 [Motiliproteus sp. MSK22-1]